MLLKSKDANFNEPHISEKTLIVRPDYDKWRNKLFRINVGVAFLILTVEITMFILLYLTNSISQTLPEYLIRFLIIPSILDFLAVGLEYILLKRYPEKKIMNNHMVMVTTILMCTVVASTHYVFSTTLAIFCIPILVSIVFNDRKIIINSSILSFFGIITAVVCRYLHRYPNHDSKLLPDFIIALSLVILSGKVSELISNLMEEQNNKLIKATMEAREAQQKAVEASRAKSSFLANMSHEIRTPINAVLGMNEMILREEKDPTIREYAMNIHSSGNSLLSIINDVLDISKIESGKIEIIETEYAVSSLINDSCSMIISRANAKKLELKTNCNEEIPRILLGDETHIRQVIVNLLTNAVKYTEKGCITLSIDSKKTENGVILTVSVRDTGIGISEENMKNLFGQFQRFDLEHNRNIEGTGLGLSITKRLTELMGGSISVKSVVGVGSEFIVEIPQKVIDPSPMGKVNISYTNDRIYKYKQSFEAPEALILAVDDIPINLLIIVNMLKATKVKIDTAESGRKCLELTAQKKYDLILMDHMMPEMDGIEVNRRLKADTGNINNNTPVIMLTANALAGVREEYMKEGFSDYISKPIRSDELEKIVKKYIPREKITADAEHDKAKAEPAAEKEEAPDNAPSIARLKKILPELNTQTALEYCCESEEFFFEVLHDFTENGRYEELARAMNERDFESYRINAHSLKSSSLTVGLIGLSEKAKESELALKNGDENFAVTHHDELMKMLKDTLDRLKTFFGSK